MTYLKKPKKGSREQGNICEVKSKNKGLYIFFENCNHEELSMDRSPSYK